MEPVLPFDPATAAASFSAVAAVLAGFALAALILLVERTNDAAKGQHEAYSPAMLLLFISFFVGSITAFLFASTTGDKDYSRRAMYSFMFPSATFATTVFTLVSGISFLVNTLAAQRILTFLRFVTWCIIPFGILRLLMNNLITLDYFGTTPGAKISVGVASILPLLFIPLFVKRGRSADMRSMDNVLFGYGYCAVSTALVLAALQSIYPMTLGEQQVHYPLGIAITQMILVSGLGAWSILLFPKQLRAVGGTPDATA